MLVSKPDRVAELVDRRSYGSIPGERGRAGPVCGDANPHRRAPLAAQTVWRSTEFTKTAYPGLVGGVGDQADADDRSVPSISTAVPPADEPQGGGGERPSDSSLYRLLLGALNTRLGPAHGDGARIRPESHAPTASNRFALDGGRRLGLCRGVDLGVDRAAARSERARRGERRQCGRRVLEIHGLPKSKDQTSVDGGSSPS